MTSMNVCILEYNDNLLCRDLHYNFIPKFITNVKPDTKTAQDLFNNINNARYPRNLDYHDRNSQRVRRRPENPRDFDFFPKAGVPLKYASGIDVTMREANEGAIIIDLKNKKIINLSHSSPLGSGYLINNRTLIHKDENDPRAHDKYNECKNKGGSHYDCIQEAYWVRATYPRGFARITIDMEGIPSREYSREAEDFIDKLKRCNHPSGELYRSIGACLDEDWFAGKTI